MASQLMIIAVCLLTLCTAQSKNQGDFEGLLDIIFNSANKSLQLDEYTAPPGNVCGFGKECVQRNLCKSDGFVKKFGENMLDIRIDHDNPCGYLETCCNVLEKLTQPPPDVTPHLAQSSCGTRHANGVVFKITGAENGEAEFAEFPWMVAISTIMEPLKIYKCGGAVIAPNVVLTAAHCVWNVEADSLTARAGEWDAQTTQEPQVHQDARIKEIIRHEDFSPSTIANDIALLILETPFNWAPNVQPICLPEADANFDHARCFATGWGKDKFGKDGLYQVILKKIELPVVPSDTCQENLRRTRLSRFFHLDKSFICAGGERGKDTCKGDGGSPLVCPDPKKPDRYYQAGIVSWGVGCGEENIPGAYANVPYLRSWITGKLSAKGIDFKHFTA